MSFKPTSIVEWILLGYGGFVVVLALIVTPLVIGLGDKGSNSSPLSVVRFSHGVGFQMGAGVQGVRRSRFHSRSRARRYRHQPRQVASSSDPCMEAIERMIACTQDPAVQRALKSRKAEMAIGCRKLKKEVRNARRCVKIKSCKAFERCLSGS